MLQSNDQYQQLPMQNTNNNININNDDDDENEAGDEALAMIDDLLNVDTGSGYSSGEYTPLQPLDFEDDNNNNNNNDNDMFNGQSMAITSVNAAYGQDSMQFSNLCTIFLKFVGYDF
jgi:hypothetical protein